jgi:membrane protein DedA with SNARE-associated domain
VLADTFTFEHEGHPHHFPWVAVAIVAFVVVLIVVVLWRRRNARRA